MPELEAPMRPTVGEPAARRAAPPQGGAPVADMQRPIAIPRAFYHDADTPPPPPDDPHWREWPHEDDREPVPRLMSVGLPVAIGVFGVLHILAILVVLHISGPQ